MKQIIEIILLILLLTMVMTGCNGPSKYEYEYEHESYLLMNVYKTNNDYSQNVYVVLSPDKNYIISGGATFPFVTKLTNGYYAHQSCQKGLNIAYLSITELEWEQSINGENRMSYEEQANYIIDNDPYIEFYREKSEYYGQLMKDNSIDTAKINDMIKTGELEIFFDKLK